MRFDNLAFQAFTMMGIPAPRQAEIEALAAHIRTRGVHPDDMMADGLPIGILDEIPDVLARLGERTSPAEIAHRSSTTSYNRRVYRSAQRGRGHDSRSVRLRNSWRRQPGVRSIMTSALMAA